MADKIGIAISGALLVPLLAVSADEQRPGEARRAAWNWPARSRRPRTTSAPRTCWSCPARSTSRGAPITSRCPTTSATSGRARRSASSLPPAEKLKVSLNIENIFFNGYLMTPMEMNAFVDSFNSERVRVHFDTGNIMMFQFPEHWIAASSASGSRTSTSRSSRRRAPTTRWSRSARCSTARPTGRR